MRARSSAKLFSSSAHFGASTPASRATHSFAVSVAIWTWRVNGSMSGASRQVRKLAASNFFAAAWASALSSQASMFSRLRLKTWALAACTESGIGSSEWQDVVVRCRRRGVGSDRLAPGTYWRPPGAQGVGMAGLDLWAMAFVFMLATFIGFDVIRNVSRLLHTPLMSLTNAISAIAVVGSIIIAGEQKSTFSTVLGTIAVAASVTNIVSGFLITDRMLRMFKRREPGK